MFRRANFICFRKKEITSVITGRKLGLDAGFIEMIKSVEYLDSALAVTDNEIICNGVKVIETSGHMPGDISIYIESMKTLINGDVLISEGGVLDIADEQFMLDKEAEINSLKKIVNLDIEEIICFHGGEYKSNSLKEDLKKLLQRDMMIKE